MVCLHSSENKYDYEYEYEHEYEYKYEYDCDYEYKYKYEYEYEYDYENKHILSCQEIKRLQRTLYWNDLVWIALTQDVY